MKHNITLIVNGDTYQLAVDPWRTLNDVLREDLNLTGTKKGCEMDGKEIMTVEGLAPSGESLHVIQEAFIEKGAIQCGFCTPGMELSALYLLKNNPSPNEKEIREGLSGNLCRCTGYTKIVFLWLKFSPFLILNKIEHFETGPSGNFLSGYLDIRSRATTSGGGDGGRCTMTIPRFEYHAPETLEEASMLLKKGGKEAVVMAGGTDLLIKLRYGVLKAATVIGLKGIRGLDEIRFDGHKGVTIGATALLSDVASHPAVLRHFPTVAEAALKTATVQIRNMGTVVGNLCNAAPSADNAPILLAMGAHVLLTDAERERSLPLGEFFKRPGLTALRSGEIVKGVFVPLSPPHSGTAYESISERGKVDIAAVGVATMVEMNGDQCSDVRIALGAVAPIPMRASGAEKLLRGKTWSNDQVEKAALRASREVKPISDMRATAAYRRKMAQVLTRRALYKAYHAARA